MIDSLADCADLCSNTGAPETLNAKRRTLNALSRDVGLLQIKRLQRECEARPALDKVLRFGTNDRQVGEPRNRSDREGGSIAQLRTQGSKFFYRQQFRTAG
jgi:hypothetical protein